jgi:uncharacterized protein YndB with AHSA1/START domain
MSAFQHTRAMKASAGAIFQALADPARLARWWGPDGFTNTFQAFEFAPGGTWVFTMHGPDGSSYPNQARFTDLRADALVAIQHLSEPHFLLTITLTPTVEGTLVTWTQAFEDPAVAAKVRHIVEPANEQNLRRWEQEVTAQVERA